METRADRNVRKTRVATRVGRGRLRESVREGVDLRLRHVTRREGARKEGVPCGLLRSCWNADELIMVPWGEDDAAVMKLHLVRSAVARREGGLSVEVLQHVAFEPVFAHVAGHFRTDFES